MDNRLIVTAICWQTRSIPRQRQAVERCQNYGLKSLTGSFWIGMLRLRERHEISRWFEETLTRKTDNFHVFSLCKTCYVSATLQRIGKGDLSYPQFEIVG